MTFSEISLRARLIGGSVFAIAILLIVCTGFLRAFSQQEQVVRDIKQEEIARSAQIGVVLTTLSDVHRSLTETLTAATQNKVDEEGIFDRGRAAIDSVRGIAQRFAASRALFEDDGTLLALFDAAVHDLNVYRSTVISVVEMSSANAQLASAEMLKASLSYAKLVESLSKVARLNDEEIAHELDDMLAGSRTTHWYLLLGGLGALVILALLSVLFYRDISRTIRTIVDVLNALARGEVGMPVPNQHRSDEIGAVARSIELFRAREIERRSLLDREQDRQAAERNRAASIANIIDEFRATVAATIAAAAETILRMKTTSGELTATVAEAGRHARDVAGSAGAMSSNVSIVAGVAEELSTSFTNVNAETSRANALAGRVAEATEQANGLVDQLANNADRIDAITRMISDVTGQINLLALNATIEAARAGQFGRGFAVVASEVKALAGQTASATTQIDSQIAALQALMTSVVKSVQSIGTSVVDVTGSTGTITAAVEQQGVAAGEIAEICQHTAADVKRLSASMAVVTQAMDKTDRSAAAVLDASGALSAHTATLQNAINAFLARVAAA